MLRRRRRRLILLVRRRRLVLLVVLFRLSVRIIDSCLRRCVHHWHGAAGTWLLHYDGAASHGAVRGSGSLRVRIVERWRRRQRTAGPWKRRCVT